MDKVIKFYKTNDPVILYSITGSFFLALIILILFGFFLKQLPDKIPLLYSLPWGDKQLVPTTEVLLLPALSVLISLINLSLSWHLHSSQLLLKRVLSSASFVFSLLIFITALKVIFIFL